MVEGILWYTKNTPIGHTAEILSLLSIQQDLAEALFTLRLWQKMLINLSQQETSQNSYEFARKRGTQTIQV